MNATQPTFEQGIRKDFSVRMTALRQRAEALSARITADARKTAELAGLSPDMPFLHAHNAICGLHYGKPWSGVNYSLARKVLWLEKQSWEPSRLVDRIYRREWNRMIDATNGCEPRYTDNVAGESETLA